MLYQNQRKPCLIRKWPRPDQINGNWSNAEKDKAPIVLSNTMLQNDRNWNRFAVVRTLMILAFVLKPATARKVGNNILSFKKLRLSTTGKSGIRPGTICWGLVLYTYVKGERQIN
ncbi:MAG: hypothetical protein IPF54_02800 [Draconibacterium sp.]|nr:hypothetical protein [Draconibacterium sp.]